MPSATKKLDIIRKRKDKPSKANRRADDKRTAKNRQVLKDMAASSEK